MQIRNLLSIQILCLLLSIPCILSAQKDIVVEESVIEQITISGMGIEVANHVELAYIKESKMGHVVRYRQMVDGRPIQNRGAVYVLDNEKRIQYQNVELHTTSTNANILLKSDREVKALVSDYFSSHPDLRIIDSKLIVSDKDQLIYQLRVISELNRFEKIISLNAVSGNILDIAENKYLTDVARKKSGKQRANSNRSNLGAVTSSQLIDCTLTDGNNSQFYQSDPVDANSSLVQYNLSSYNINSTFRLGTSNGLEQNDDVQYLYDGVNGFLTDDTNTFCYPRPLISDLSTPNTEYSTVFAYYAFKELINDFSQTNVQVNLPIKFDSRPKFLSGGVVYDEGILKFANTTGLTDVSADFFWVAYAYYDKHVQDDTEYSILDVSSKGIYSGSLKYLSQSYLWSKFSFRDGDHTCNYYGNYNGDAISFDRSDRVFDQAVGDVNKIDEFWTSMLMKIMTNDGVADGLGREKTDLLVLESFNLLAGDEPQATTGINRLYQTAKMLFNQGHLTREDLCAVKAEAEAYYADVNAFVNDGTALDMMVKDSHDDIGTEPNPNWSTRSPYIWNRRNQDGQEGHQSPIGYVQNDEDYLYVKVTNNTCRTLNFQNDPILHTYYTYATLGSSWDEDWVDHYHNGYIVGDEIGNGWSIAANSFLPGETITQGDFPYTLPTVPDAMPTKFGYFRYNPVFYLARIESFEDQHFDGNIGDPIYKVVKNNNNNAMRSTSTLYIECANCGPGTSPTNGLIGSDEVIFIKNAYPNPHTYLIRLDGIERNGNHVPLSEHIEVNVTLSDDVYRNWVINGANVRGGVLLPNGDIKVNSLPFEIEGVSLDSDDLQPIAISYRATSHFTKSGLDISLINGNNQKVGSQRTLLIEGVDSQILSEGSVQNRSSKDKESNSVFPNPVSDVLTLNLTEAIEGSLIAIYNANGKKVGSHSVNQKQISVERYEPGVYFLNFINLNKEKQTIQFLKE